MAKLIINLEIGEGLTMNCIIDFSTRLSSEKDQKGIDFDNFVSPF